MSTDRDERRQRQDVIAHPSEPFIDYSTLDGQWLQMIVFLSHLQEAVIRVLQTDSDL